MIYLDNAATTLIKPEQVSSAVCQAMHTIGSYGRGAHTASLDAARIVYDARCKAAALFGIPDPGRIAFTTNATHSLNIAIKGVLQAGDHVITTSLEHNSVLRPLYEMEERGCELTILPCSSNGSIDWSEAEKNIKSNTKAILCTHASNVTGMISDLKKVSEICRKFDLLFILDAAQTAGVLPINAVELGIDILCFTGHKGLMGPQGTGGIYIREGISVSPLYTGGTGYDSFSKLQPADMPAHLEAGTMNVHGIAGLLAALTFIEQTGVTEIFQKEKHLADIFYQGIRIIPGIRIYGDIHSERCAIVSINIGDVDSAIISAELEERFQILTRPGAHCAPLLHPYFGTQNQGMVRFSFGFYNSEKEVAEAVRAVGILAEDFV